MRKHIWLRGFGIVVALAIMALIPWNWTDQPLVPSGDKLTIAIPKPSISVPLWVADAEGFFAQEGLDATVISFDIGKLGFESMLKGEADVAAVATTPVVLASFVRNDFVIFAAVSFSDNSDRIVARRDRGIARPADLKGKTIGVARGTSAEFFLEDFLARHGLSEAVKLSDMPPGESPRRLLSGEVDAVCAFEPFALMASKQLAGNGIVFAAPGTYRETFYVVARRDFARDRLPALIKFLRSLARAEDFIRTHPGEVNETMAHVWGLAPAEAGSLVAETHSSLSLRQSMIRLLEDEARWALQNGLVDAAAVPNYVGFIDPAPMKAVRPDAVTIIE